MKKLLHQMDSRNWLLYTLGSNLSCGHCIYSEALLYCDSDGEIAESGSIT